ncbi:hypothetical protein P152DRAFT_254083 [Eremomyces bilateralis CBS 781.70]|uniref:Uncharacterized protein n=1 Tax=Eremomyces bilateralis CBS 781.70 TaxID=1392243 RepID=A0A6G1FR34_9PEZI|nr:uncharacterized protein P152DRAFT_254083 [Eremomyces bilateralis CBS 781.70]KAF1808149.1 hypothetical protein P152DRAFT_254083 [Eremomyces bilateralis CBS 781.70]
MHAQPPAAPDPAKDKGNSGSHVCPLCDTGFGRLEHLSRHIISHTGSKPYSCYVCHKSFNRKDTLLRHLPIHEDTGRSSSKPGSIRISRACAQCGKVRLRCDGESPCARCQSKGINCMYLGRSRKRIPTIEELREMPVKGNESDPGELGDDQNVEYSTSERRPSLQSRPPSLDRSVRMDETATFVETSSLLPSHLTDQVPLSSSEPLVIDTQQESVQASQDALESSAFFGSGPSIGDIPSTAVPTWNFNWNGDSDFSVMDWITTDNCFLDPGPSMAYDASRTLGYPGSSHDTGFGQNDFPMSQLYKPPDQHPPTHQVPMGHITGHWGPTNQGKLGDRPKAKADLEREWPTNWDPTKSDNLVSFPDMSEFPLDILEAESFGHVESLSPQAYHEIYQSMKRVGSSLFRPFHNANLPSIEAFDCFTQLYFEYFHPIFPLLHKPSFDPRNAPWQLVLATATIGFRYSKVPYAATGSNALQELLRRSLASAIEGDNSHARELWFTQALLLGSVGMTYSGNRRLLEIAESGRNASITQCRRKGVLRRMPTRVLNLDSITEKQSYQEEWQQWIEDESRRRLGFCTFLIDAQNELYFDAVPYLSLAELELLLPCSEDLWAASSPEWWRNLYLQHNHDDDLTVQQALAQLGNNKTLPKNISDFGRLILTFALYRTIRTIRTLSGNPFVSNALSERSFINDSANEAIFLLQGWYSGPLNTKSMLNSSVDCHNLCVSMLLCSPRQALLSYVHRRNTMQHEKEPKEVIDHWIKEQNGCVARRAVSYAGLLLGKSKGLKFQAPCTPIMIALATVTIWAYSHMTEVVSSPSYSHGIRARERGSVIRLDDGELDQRREAWIQGDESFRAHLNDVGNICRQRASYRIADVGVQLLDDLGGWGLSQGLEHWLSTLRNRDWSRQQADLRSF